MEAEDSPFDVVPENIIQFMQQTYTSLREFSGLNESNSTNHIFRDFDLAFVQQAWGLVRWRDISNVIFLTLFFLVFRCLLNSTIFRPFCRWVDMRPTDASKFPECAWKMIYYIFMWAYTFDLVVLSERHHFFQRPCQVWMGYGRMDAKFWEEDFNKMQIPTDIYWLYIISMSYYLHGVYSLLFHDIWRKDSFVMLFHHFLTLCLLSLSFILKFHRIGTLVLFLHDISDVLLEITKLNIYLKFRGNRVHRWNDLLSTVIFVIFVISWAVCRLYWYPMKVLHASNWCVYVRFRHGMVKFFHVFNFMLTFLFLLHIYWFGIIVRLLFKIVTGQLKDGVEDTREYDVEETAVETYPPSSSNSNQWQLKKDL